MVYSAHCRVQLSCNNFLEKSNRFTQSRPHRQSFTRIYAQAGSVDADVIVVGAGVAGLNCAAKLHSAGIPVILLEASDGVGGRVRTDKHPDGFLLDRGFQIFLTSCVQNQSITHSTKSHPPPLFSSIHYFFTFPSCVTQIPRGT